mmetsp:Transcript_31690/g.58551  ORF Transcript_31690/g.58551 Transcript_31690/m.58551 type:complete len:81 (+) Transcript_31690:340-582(+)
MKLLKLEVAEESDSGLLCFGLLDCVIVMVWYGVPSLQSRRTIVVVSWFPWMERGSFQGWNCYVVFQFLASDLLRGARIGL